MSKQAGKSVFKKTLLASCLMGVMVQAGAENVEKKPDKVSIDLSRVVVTASGFDQEIKDAPASISIVDGDELRDQPFEGLGDALKNVEGINVERGGKSGGANIGIRGLPNDYTLLLIDGKRLSQNSSGARPNGFGDVDTNFIPPASAIERIEVVRGPMSTLYGSDALGGVVNVITKKVPDKWGGELNLHHIEPTNSDFGSHSSTSLYLAGPLKENLLGLAVMGSFQHAGNAKGTFAKNQAEEISGNHTGKYSSFSGLGQKKNYNYGARLTFTPDSHNDITLSYDRGVQRYDNSEAQLGTLNTMVLPGKAGGGYDDELKFTRDRISLSHEGRYDFATIESSILWDTTKTIGRLNPVSKPAMPADGTARDIKYTNLVLDHKWMMGLGNHFFSAGLQYKNEKLTDSIATAPLDAKQWQWALFAEDEWMINDSLTATFGLRYDKNEHFGSHFSPRAYLTWAINDEWQLKGGVSRAFRAPDVNLMQDGVIGYGRQGRLPLLGNKDLSPETATSAELGLYFDNNSNFSANGTVFYTRFKDKIESVTVDNCQVMASNGCVDLGSGWDHEQFSKRYNVDNAKLYGLELTARYQIFDDLGLRASYTYTDSKYDNKDGIKVPFSQSPKHMLNLRADWQAHEAWNVWAEAEYRAKQFNDLNWNNEKVYYRSYAIMNLGAKYTMTDNLSFSAGIYNVFDKKFMDYDLSQVGSKPPSATSDYSNKYRRNEEGRRFWLSMKYTF